MLLQKRDLRRNRPPGRALGQDRNASQDQSREIETARARRAPKTRRRQEAAADPALKRQSLDPKSSLYRLVIVPHSLTLVVLIFSSLFLYYND